MITVRRILLCAFLSALVVPTIPAASAADETGDELVQMVVGLLGDKDKDLRAVGLDQIRKEAKGEKATQQFAAQLPKVMPDVQVALLSALADRGDRAARPAVLELLGSSKDGDVRVAAVAALGSLGELGEIPLLIKSLSAESKPEQAAAKASLVRLRGEAVPAAIATQSKQARPAVRAALMDVLASRRALGTVPEILSAAVDADADVRKAAMIALGQLATSDHVGGMLQGVLKAEPGPEREAAEKAIALVCGRIENVNERAAPVLAKLSEKNQVTLLSAVGRVGGTKALAVVEEALNSPNSTRHEAGLVALCNWPDATVADKLFALTKTADTPAHRTMTFQALVRVGSLRQDGRTDEQRLDRMKQAMILAQTPAEHSLVINRCRAAYIVESLRFILPYLDQPEYAQLACESIVELAHHRELREPNKVEFDKALDRVIATTKDAVLIERSNRYKNGQTWERPKPPTM